MTNWKEFLLDAIAPESMHTEGLRYETLEDGRKRLKSDADIRAMYRDFRGNAGQESFSFRNDIINPLIALFHGNKNMGPEQLQPIPVLVAPVVGINSTGPQN